MLTRILLASTVVGLAMVTAGAAHGADIFPNKVHQKTLANGLRVMVIPYDSPGTVAYFSVVRTGSRDEVEPGHSGFAHFFEHMMFQGTERYPTDVYNNVLKRMGADSNAFTSDDYTNYYIIGPAAELETIMKIEADRFLNLEYSEDDFRREALAVLGEYNKSASSPFLPMYERMRDLAFTKHTYKHTTIGFLDDIRAMPDYYDYSLGFFARFYRPENTILLVVGDAAPETVFALAKHHYGDWKKGYQSPSIESEPPAAAGAGGKVDWPAPIRPHLMAGYRVPAFSSANVDTAALDVLNELLFSESAPLYQKLVVDEQWADFVSAGYRDHRDPYLFTIYTRVKSEELLPKVRAAIDEHLEALKKEPVDPDRLERIKSHLRYRFATGLDSPASVGFTISSYLALTGDPATVNRVYERYQEVSPDDIQRVARQTFRSEALTAITLAHTPEAPAQQAGDQPVEGE